MNPVAIIFFIVIAIALMVVPRKWAPVPLLIGCCYMTKGQGIELASLSFAFYRMLLFVGIARIVAKGERLSGTFNTIDKLIIAWGIWMVFASLFHNGESGSGPIYVSGMVIDIVGVYFLMRIWCSDLDQVVFLITVAAFLLAPVALEMLMEKITKKNMFSVFGGVPIDVGWREGKYRAQGPFNHPILAGTVGATCLPLFIGILKRNYTAAIIGIISALTITIACASSGPMMSAMAGVCAVAMWRFRHLTKLARAAAVAGYFAYMILTGEPGYFIMKRIDLSGGSTGYFRARLIESATEHLNEWWLFGTDVTRHWMETGVSFSPNHTDITNYYLGFGVAGGLAAVILLILMLLTAFKWVGVFCRGNIDRSPNDSFVVWCLGAGMLAHAATSISVSYFDQSYLFFWLNLAVISSVYTAYVTRQEPEVESCDEVEQEDFRPKDAPEAGASFS